MTRDRLKLYFRWLIIACLIIDIFYAVASDLEAVPDISQDFSLMPLFGLALIAVASLCSLVGMFFFRSWARQLFLVTTVLLYTIILPFLGSQAYGAWENTFDGISTWLEGCIIVAAYFSPIRKAFMTKSFRGIYLAYQHPVLGFAVVKRGFSWPAFFFGWIWAFVKKLNKQGMIILAGILLLGMFIGVFTQAGMEASAFTMRFYFIVFFMFVGYMGNYWLRESFINRGYQFCGEYPGKSADAVLAEIAKKQG